VRRESGRAEGCQKEQEDTENAGPFHTFREYKAGVSIYDEGVVSLRVVDLGAFALRFAKRTAAEALQEFQGLCQYTTEMVLDKIRPNRCGVLMPGEWVFER
jgi:hypothetical protein